MPASNTTVLKRGVKDFLVVSPHPVVVVSFIVSIAYYLGARLGFALTVGPHPVSLLWPANTILLVALLLAPVRHWGIILLAVFPAHLAAEWESGVPLAMVLSWFVSNCSEALLGAAATRFFIRGELAFDRFRTICVFLVCGALLAPLVSSFLDAALVQLNHWGKDTYWEVWRLRFFSNIFATSTIGAAVLTWVAGGPRPRLSTARVVEAGLLVTGLVIVVSLVVFHPVVERPQLMGSLWLYAPWPFLLWAALRFGTRGASTAILIVSILTIWSVAHAHPQFLATDEQNVRMIQVFFVAKCLMLLPLASVLTERERVAQDLRVSEERYRGVVETQPDLICRYLPDTTLTFANEAYCRFFGETRRNLIGRKLLEFFPPALHAQVVRGIDGVSKGGPAAVWERLLTLPNGRNRWVQWMNYAVTDANGRVQEIQGIGKDVTDRKRAEEARQNLIHASRLAVIGEFTAMVAHEVNQPLSAILTNSEAAEALLKHGTIPLDKVRGILADIHQDILRVAETIGRMRALSQRREMEMQPLDLNRLIEEVVQLAGGDASRRHVRLETELAPGLPMGRGDPIHLQHVLLNLISNGMDALSDLPESERLLVIKTQNNNRRELVVAVKDAGHGIPPEELPRVFESFFSTKEGGMGLGLAIARTIVKAHHGAIWVEKNPDRGVTFIFTLPLEKPKEIQPPEPGTTTVVAGMSKRSW